MVTTNETLDQREGDISSSPVQSSTLPDSDDEQLLLKFAAELVRMRRYWQEQINSGHKRHITMFETCSAHFL